MRPEIGTSDFHQHLLEWGLLWGMNVESTWRTFIRDELVSYYTGIHHCTLRVQVCACYSACASRNVLQCDVWKIDPWFIHWSSNWASSGAVGSLDWSRIMMNSVGPMITNALNKLITICSKPTTSKTGHQERMLRTQTTLTSTPLKINMAAKKLNLNIIFQTSTLGSKSEFSRVGFQSQGQTSLDSSSKTWQRSGAIPTLLARPSYSRNSIGTIGTEIASDIQRSSLSRVSCQGIWESQVVQEMSANFEKNEKTKTTMKSWFKFHNFLWFFRCLLKKMEQNNKEINHDSCLSFSTVRSLHCLKRAGKPPFFEVVPMHEREPTSDVLPYLLFFLGLDSSQMLDPSQFERSIVTTNRPSWAVN